MAAIIEEVRAVAGPCPLQRGGTPSPPEQEDGRWSSVDGRSRFANDEQLMTCDSSTIMQFFSAHDSPCDFGTPFHASVSIIFLLTSFCVDSIHSTSCNKTPLRNSMKNGKGE